MDDRRGPGRSLEILRVKERLDAYFRAGESAKAEALLRYWEAETRASGDRRGLLEILSEEIGFFRDPDEADSAIACAREAAEIVYGEKMEEGVSGATILLNAATTENAFGDKQRARSLFGQAKRVLERELPAGDKRLAGLYNNMASLYSEEDPERALAYFEKALAVLSAQDVPDCEAAVTYVNMAALLHTRDPLDERIPPIWTARRRFWTIPPCQEPIPTATPAPNARRFSAFSAIFFMKRSCGNGRSS